MKNKNSIIMNELKELVAENGEAFFLIERTYENSYDTEKENTPKNKEIKNFDIDVSNLNFDFFSNKNTGINLKPNKFYLHQDLYLKLLSNLLEKDILPLKEIKKISFGDNEKIFYNWDNVKQLFLYNNNDISILTKKYTSQINEYTINEIIQRIVKGENSVENIINFSKNHIKKIKNHQINLINNFLIEHANEEDLNSFNKFLELKNKTQNNNLLFEEKENKFEYLNLNVQAFMKKFFFNAPDKRLVTVSDYEKIVKDTISFLKSHKKKLLLENIYFENRTANKNDFLITIETKDGFNKEFTKRIFLEYVNIYINKIRNIKHSESNGWIFKAHKELKDNTEKIANFIFLKINTSDTDKIKPKLNKI